MSESDEVFLLLDTSESMKGESLRMAQRIALQVLKALGSNIRVNIVLFGTGQFSASVVFIYIVIKHKKVQVGQYKTK